jgi:hypothetical protein
MNIMGGIQYENRGRHIQTDTDRLARRQTTIFIAMRTQVIIRDELRPVCSNTTREEVPAALEEISTATAGPTAARKE